MKATLPQPEHASYRRHRKQWQWQILLPIILSAVVVAGLAALAAWASFQPAGEPAKWGSIAAIWIIIPLMIAVLVFTLILAALVYLLSKLLGILPVYSGKLQDLVYRLEGIIKKFTNILVKPIFALDEIGATLRALVGRR
jgi:hypothetical protein